MGDDELPTALYVLAVLNVADVVLTLIMLEAGGMEANPVMAAVLRRGGPPAFVVAKLGLAGAGLAILHRLWRLEAARLVAFGLALIYAGVVLVHVSTLAALAGGT